MLDPENAAVNVEYIWYSTPNTGAIDILGEDYTDDPIMNPSQEVIDKSEVFSDLDANTLRLYDNAWIEVKCEQIKSYNPRYKLQDYSFYFYKKNRNNNNQLRPQKPLLRLGLQLFILQLLMLQLFVLQFAL